MSQPLDLCDEKYVHDVIQEYQTQIQTNKRKREEEDNEHDAFGFGLSSDFGFGNPGEATSSASKRAKQAQPERPSPEEFYTEPLDPDMYACLRQYFRPPVHLTKEEVRALGCELELPASLLTFAAHTYRADDPDSSDLADMTSFLRTASQCKVWLDQELQRVGWSQNLTGIEPVSNAQSVQQLVEEVNFCFRVACIQAWRMLEDARTYERT